MTSTNFIKKYLFALLPVLAAVGCFYFYLGNDFTYFQDDESYVRYTLLFSWQDFFNGAQNSYFPFGYALALVVFKDVTDFLGMAFSIINIAKIFGLISAGAMSLLIYKYILEKTKSYSYSVLSTLLIITPSGWYLHVYGGINSEHLYFPLYFICFLVAVRQKGQVGPLWSLCFGLLSLVRHMHIAFLPLIFIAENTSYKKRFYNFLISLIPAFLLHLIYFLSDNPARDVLTRDLDQIYPALFTSLYGFFNVWGESFYYFYYNFVVIFYVILFIVLFLAYKKHKMNFERKWALTTSILFIFIIVFTNQFLDHGVHFGVRLILFPMIVLLPIFFADLYVFKRIKYITITNFACISFLSLYSFGLHPEVLEPLFIEKNFFSNGTGDLIKKLHEKSEQKLLLTNRPGLIEDFFNIKATSVFTRERFTAMGRLRRDGAVELPKKFYGIYFYRRDGLDYFDLLNRFKDLDQCDVRFPYVPELMNYGNHLYRIVVKFRLNDERWKLYNECLNAGR
jgi:hypothetical protein